MKFLSRLLADGTDISAFNSEQINQISQTMFSTFQSIMGIIMPIVLGVVAALGVFYSVKLGIGYAQSETTEKREEAKKRLVGAIVGFGIGIVAAALMWWVFTSQMLESLFTNV